MGYARDVENQCSAAINLTLSDYQATAEGTTAKLSSTIPINMILLKGRPLGPHTVRYQPVAACDLRD
jgi:hypothetical protein